jgi:prepilin-type N-terminal cleavage/methylation domain-containing protein
MNEHVEDRKEQGFTLIELLIAIVVVGILTAVAIVGIAGLTNNGKTAACSATQDAAKASQAVYYSNNNGTYPTSFDDVLGTADGGTANPAMLELSGGASRVDATHIKGSGWTLTATSGGGTAPMTFSGCP